MGQGRASRSSDVLGHKAGAASRAIPAEAIRAELDRVLLSHEFRASRRCQDFLRFVIENTLSGHSDALKERTIGVEVFGRPSSYDPSDDATVRVKAGEVRKRLGLYYAGEGRHNEVRLELPAGSYVPDFSWGEPSQSAEEGATASLKTKRSWIWWPVVLCLVGVLAVVLLAWFRSRPANRVLTQFWSPVLQGSAPVLVCAAFVPDVYGVRPEIRSGHPEKLEDFVRLPDQFVGGGDLLAVSRVSSMLTKMQRAYRVKIGDDVSFLDLRAAPAVLVGYSYTRWKEISKELRFFIDASRWPLGVTDNGAPTKWILPVMPRDRRTTEDYAIVSRVFHPDTRAMLVEMAGITQYGTDAATELMTNSDLLAEALRNAPEGWQNKNLQLVLHVKVISGVPASPNVVAIHLW